MQRYAVLSFTNQAGPTWDYLATGLTDAAQQFLVAVPSLIVISRESVDALPTTAAGPLADAFKRLSTDVVITGRLITKGTALRLQLEAFEPDDADPIWQHRLSTSGDEPAALAEEMREVLSRHLAFIPYSAPAAAASPEPAEGSPHPAPSLPRNHDAHRAYLLGNHYLHRWERGPAELALEQFDLAARLEPTFIPARLGRARAVTFLVGRGYRRAEIEYPRVLELLDRSIAFAPNYGDLYIARGIIEFFYLLDWDSAYRNLERGLTNLSEASEAYAQLSLFWYGMREYDRSLEALQVASEYNPLSISLLQMRGDVLLSAERYEESAAVFKSILDLRPGDKPALENLMYLAALRRNERRTRYYLRLLLAGTEFDTAAVTYPRLGYVYAHLGMEAATKRTLDLLHNLVATDPDNVQFGRLANVYAGLGDHPRLLDCAEQAFARRQGILFVLTDPQFRPVRTHERYRRLEAQVKIPDRLTGEHRLRIQSKLKAYVDVTPENLLCARAEGNYVTLVIYNNFRVEEKLLRMTMKRLTQQLPDPPFWRCHKSYVVNTGLEHSIVGNARRRYFVSGQFGFRVPVGRGEVLRK